MASKLPIVVPPMRGEDAYERYLANLEAEARSRGHRVEGRTATVELALNLIGFQWGLMAPRRVKPVGSNRYGEPGAKKDGG